MTTMAARAQRRGVAVLAEPIVTRVLPSRRSSSRQCARVNHAAMTATTASHNPWLPIRRNASARVGCTDEDPDVFFGPVDSSVNGKFLIWEKKALAIAPNAPYSGNASLRHFSIPQHSSMAWLVV